MSKVTKIWLYWNTIKRLQWIQIRYQIKKRILPGTEKKLLNSVQKLPVPETRNIEKIKILIPEIDWEDTYLQRFHVEDLLHNQVRLLHETYAIQDTWKMPKASHLWNYNLHYLEFLVPLAVEYSKTSEEAYFLKWKELTESWLSQSAEDSLEPYTISMRIPNMLICIELLGARLKNTVLEKQLLTSIYRQYRYLMGTQELALLANHYFENLKGIVIASLFFHELDIYHKYYELFLKQIEEQILPDGFHFELSFMYHKIILEDILRVHKVLSSLEHREDAERLVPIIEKMAAVMMKLEKGFGNRTPLFNDAGNNVAKGRKALSKAVEKICRPESEAVKKCGTLEKYEVVGKCRTSEKYKATEKCRILEKCEAAGYYRISVGDMTVLFDCGDIGPSYMGGHGHCDCLSFELGVKHRILFANSGTGQYQGELRSFFRSTSAHNTLMIDDREQSELWGEHRAGRRIRDIKEIEIENGVGGSFRSYQGDCFRRILKWKNETRLVLTDDFMAHDKGSHIAREFLHLAPGYEYRSNENQIDIRDGERLVAVIRILGESDYLFHKEGVFTAYAEDFGEYKKKQVLEIRTPFEDKVRVRMEIEITV